MKDTIYTIPVTEAFAEGANECPFCAMYRKLNENSLEFTMGPSYMEDDVRMETNKIGFCGKHLNEMYLRSNRLGLGLMMHTHLMQINKDLGAFAKKAGKPGKGGLFRSKREGGGRAGEITEYLKGIEHSCFICDKINSTFERYIDTFFHLWIKDNELRAMVGNGRGFCLNHFYLLLETGEKKLSAKEYETFFDTIVPFELNALKTLEDDLDWFIRKFDYRNANEPWKQSKDALIRALLKISSITVD